MKSKKRHEMQTNELADRLGHFIERVRPYGTTILFAIVGLVAIFSAWFWLAGNREKQKGDGWRAYMAVGTNLQVDVTDELGEVADDFNGTSAGVWAAQMLADIELSRGVRLLFKDRALAETSLNTAKGRYREVIEDGLAKKIPMLKMRAQLGLAQTHEALSELDDAKKAYETVIESSSGTAEAKLAEQRLASLNNTATQKWYNWFERQKPAPPESEPSPPSALGPAGLGGLESGLDNLLDLGNLPDTAAEDFMDDTNPSESETSSQDKPKDAAPPESGPDLANPSTTKSSDQ